MTSLREVIAGVSKQMRLDFEEISSQATHMGERGRAREDSIRGFLRNYLPDRVGVGQGGSTSISVD